MADRGLGDAQFVGGVGKAHVAGRSLEGTQSVERWQASHHEAPITSHELFLSKQDKGSFVKHRSGSQIPLRQSVTPSGSSPMADLSLHYSSKAPLAGTYTALHQIFETWRRRARERRELATLDRRTIHDL